MDSQVASDTNPHGGTGQSPFIAFIFIFNLIVGTGALAMPKAFAQAGWLVSTFVIITLALMSFMSVTFVIESMSIANYMEKKRLKHQTSVIRGNTSVHEPTANEVETEDDESASLLPDTTSKWYDITVQKELIDMARMFLPSHWLNFASITLSIYLYGDLVIYSAAISKSLRDVTCSSTNDSSTSHDTCWIIFNDYIISRSATYRIYVIAILFTIAPFAYFNAKKTTLIQFATSACRWLAFLSMIILTSIILALGQGKGSPVTANLTGVPNLFGVCVYSFMCHHSLPLLITPIRRKEKSLYTVITSDYLLILFFYLLLSFTAVYTFDDLQQIYTLNFQKSSSSSFDIIKSVYILQYFLPLFPVFTLGSSFPIIAITLQKNLAFIIKPSLISLVNRQSTDQLEQSLVQVSSASTDAGESTSLSPRVNFWIDRIILPTLAVVPPVLMALITEDLTFWVNIVGSYAGVAVQYVTPGLIILYGRAKLKEHTIEVQSESAARIRDKLKSPFSRSAWIWITFSWSILIWLLVTINYILKSSSSNE